MALPAGIVAYVWVGLCSVVAPAMLGFGLVRWLGLAPAHGLRLAWGFGYLVGHYVLAHVTLLWLLAGQPGPGVLLPVAAVVAGLLLLRSARRRWPTAAPRLASHWSSWLPVVVLCCLLGLSFLATNAAPVRFSDEAVNWAAKAKVLYTAPGFDLSTGLGFFVDHPDYPLFNPLAQVLAFASAGRVLHFENRLPIQFFGVALLLLLSAGTTRRAHALIAALALVAFAGSSFVFLAPTAYADVMLACAVLAAGEALLRWRETGEAVFIALTGLAFGAMIATKNEGLLLVAALATPFALDAIVVRGRAGGWSSSWAHWGRHVRWRSLAWLAVPAAAFLLHRGINAWFDVQNDLTNPALGQGRGLIVRMLGQLDTNAWPVLAYYGRMLVDPALHRLLPLLFLIAAPLAWIARGRAWLTGAGSVLLLAFVAASLGYMLVFVGTIYDLGWHLDVAADRTMQHVLPLAVIGLVASVWPRAPTP